MARITEEDASSKSLSIYYFKGQVKKTKKTNNNNNSKKKKQMFPVSARFIFGARLSFLWPVIKKVETNKKEKKRGHFQHQLFYNPV